jgi:hypothetical protein
VRPRARGRTSLKAAYVLYCISDHCALFVMHMPKLSTSPVSVLDHCGEARNKERWRSREGGAFFYIGRSSSPPRFAIGSSKRTVRSLSCTCRNFRPAPSPCLITAERRQSCLIHSQLERWRSREGGAFFYIGRSSSPPRFAIGSSKRCSRLSGPTSAVRRVCTVLYF